MKKLQKVFSILLTVCMCMSLLSVAASAEGAEYLCGKTAHTHDENCYATTLICEKHVCANEECKTPATQDLICEKTPHTHTIEAGCYHQHSIAGGCYALNCEKEGQPDCGNAAGDLTCGKSEASCSIEEVATCPNAGTDGHECTDACVHIHSDACKHAHDETCYHSHNEGCTHVHKTDCYATEPKCGLTEEALDTNLICDDEVHTHENTDEQTCFVPHIHSDGCYSEPSLICNSEEHTHVAGCAYGLGVVAATDFGTADQKEYTSLEDAVTAANASEDETITLLDNITMTQALAIQKDTTIDGNDYAIVRGSYTGTFFTVAAEATLTLDGVVIDGNNDWVFLKDAFEADAKDGVRASNSSAKYAVYEAGAPVGSGTLISISGEVILDNGTTIKNHAGCQLFSVANGATLITNEATITHNTRGGTPLVAAVSSGGYWEINEGAVISNNHTDVGNGILSYMCGTSVMNGGEIYGNTGVDCNGCVMMVYGGSASFTMNGGHIYANGATYGDNNGWNPAFYVYGNGAHFTMNGGIIEDQISETYGGIANNGSNGLITLTGGTIINTISGRGFNTKDLCSYCLVKISNTMNSGTNRFYGSVENTGILNGDSWFYTYEMTYSGGGTFNGDVTVRNGAETTMVDGKWLNGVVYVNAVGTDSTLTVKPEATIDGIQVRVMDSVESGDCTNAEQASAAQAASYVEEEGAVVESPVLYYHRLTSAQKQNLVITYDYNGGLDACGWSGTQVTTDGETYLPTAEELARPFREGYTLAGWKFAADNEPECLTMEDNGETYYTIGDETINELTGTLRLIAQWTNESGSNEGGEGGSTAEPGGSTGGSNNSPSGGSTTTPNVTIEDEETPLAGGVEIDEEDVPLAALPEETEPQVTLPEEEVPLAVAPMTGDAVALWLALSALSGTGLAGVTFLGRKKNKED